MKDATRFCLTWLSAIAAVWLFLNLSSYLGLNWLKSTGTVGYVLIVSVALNIALLFKHPLLSHKNSKQVRPEKIPSEKRLSKALLSSLETMMESCDFQSVIRIGVPLSRALWLEGQYETRLAVGRMLERAASETEQVEVRAKALIDDIGWTSIAMGNSSTAVPAINRGIKLASAGFPHLAAKGLRHLAGVALTEHKPNEALGFLTQAEKESGTIKNEGLQKEMHAGIAYGRTECLIELHDFIGAKHQYAIAERLYKELSDHERQVKLLSQYGRILEAMGEQDEAVDFYRKGLAEAKRHDRKDEVIINTLLLARLNRAVGNGKDADDGIKEARALLVATPLRAVPPELSTLIKEIST
jgi:tetratricopeptide (TPR) repeat protein